MSGNRRFPRIWPKYAVFWPHYPKKRSFFGFYERKTTFSANFVKNRRFLTDLWTVSVGNRSHQRFSKKIADYRGHFRRKWPRGERFLQKNRSRQLFSKKIADFRGQLRSNWPRGERFSKKTVQMSVNRRFTRILAKIRSILAVRYEKPKVFRVKTSVFATCLRKPTFSPLTLSDFWAHFSVFGQIFAQKRLKSAQKSLRVRGQNP